jgi:RNA polymerase sigma-70 factor (ECF subfamily)
MPAAKMNSVLASIPIWRAQGANLIEFGSDFQESKEHAQKLAEQYGWRFVPLYHRDIIKGVATYWLEFFSAVADLDVVYVPIGQRSDICSCCAVRNALNLKTGIVGVVAEGAPAYALSFEARRKVAAPVTTLLDRLFRRYAGLVRRIGRRILRHPAEAEDLVQDLFLFIYKRCAIFDSSKSSARSWIIQMTYHRAIERRRYLTTRQFYAFRQGGSTTERAAVVPTTKSDYSAVEAFGSYGLEKTLSVLSEDQRETLRLYFFEGYTLAEIGGKLGQPVGNVRHHYYSALDKLRKQMFANHHAQGG